MTMEYSTSQENDLSGKTCNNKLIVGDELTRSNSTDESSGDAGGIDGSNSSSPSSDIEEVEGFYDCQYSKNPEWADIKPVVPDPHESKIMGIPYADKFREAHEYFRAIFRKNELSERALQLTEDCISWNAANSTVWVFRRKCLFALGRNLCEELEYLSNIIVDKPKNYQVWQHRRWIIEQLNDPKTEKAFTEELFKQDCKNYHAWQHRQWIISHFNWWEGELDYTLNLILDDLRNNSAWNHRYFVLKRTKQLENENVIADEVTFAIDNIIKVPDNESPWNYLRGILSSVGLNKFPEKTKVFEGINSVHCFSFRIDSLEESLKNQEKPDKFIVNKALALTAKLANEMDIIRSEYWTFVGKSISEKYDSKLKSQECD